MKENLKRSAIETLKIIGVCVLAYPVGLILMLILGGNADLAISLPFISGFIHQSLYHFLFNIVGIFLLLLYKGNKYDLKQMVLITIIIQCITLLLTYTIGIQVSIGISGLVYFMLTRFLMDFKKILIPLLVIIAIGELTTLNDPDGVSHWGHLIGIFFGIISLGYFSTAIRKLLNRNNHRMIQLVHNIFVPQQ
jgi:membrane associated rhomboid family serine protease